MANPDRRFALIRDGQAWYAVSIADQKSGETSFRISKRSVSRDACGEAERLTDLATVARRVLQEGCRVRCAPQGTSKSISLDLDSQGVTGYRLDPLIASRLGVPAEGGAR